MSQIRVAVEIINPELLQQVAALYSAEGYKKSVWSWQFAPRFGRDVVAVVARDGERVIGFNATMPVRVVDTSGDVKEAIWSCDFIVAADYRGKGVGKAIKDEMARCFQMPVMSLGISDSAFPLLLKKGWNSPARLDVWDYINRPKTFKQVILWLWAKLCKLWFYRKNRAARRSLTVDELNQLPQPEIIERLWQLHRQNNFCVEVLRDHEYLSWRYAQCPFPVYRYLHIGHPKQGSQALLIFRISSTNTLEVVDLIGKKTFAVITACCYFFLRKFPTISAIHWNTSISVIQSHLLANGFVKKSYASRFATLSSYGASTWGLVAGDSDGDFLRVAKEGAASDCLNLSDAKANGDKYEQTPLLGESVFTSITGFVYRKISVRDFYMMEAQWYELLDNSTANRLFMSWHWMVSWWQQWGEQLGLQFYCLLIYDQNKLVGILPFYYIKKGMLTHYQFIGNAWGISPTVRSEYTSPIFEKSYEKILYKDLESYIRAQSACNTFIFSDVTEKWLSNTACLQHRVDCGYKVSVAGDFEVYQASLGRMTRLKAFNRRHYLLERFATAGIFSVPTSEADLDDFFSHLNRFHCLRWGKPCFDKSAVEFHKQLLLSSLGKGALLSYLKVNDRVVSASYNIRSGDIVYNIQSGYLEDFDKKISLGTLHIGWLIQSLFESTETNYFDFLAGFGRAEDYKKHYRGVAVNFYTFQYFASRYCCVFYEIVLLLKAFGRRIQHLVSSNWNRNFIGKTDEI